MKSRNNLRMTHKFDEISNQNINMDQIKKLIETMVDIIHQVLLEGILIILKIK